MADEGFMWIRPWAWLLLVPWLAALRMWWLHRYSTGFWQRWVDPDLLEHVTHDHARPQHRQFLWLLVAVGVIGAGALAGPSWRAEPVPVFRDLSARVVVLDLSPSMLAIDTTPNRLALAKSAVTQLLREADGVQLGLVVFAGDAFTVAPLTHDAATLLHLLRTVDSSTLPRAGARVDLGLAEAVRLLEAADIARGDVHLVGDSAGDGRALRMAERLAETGFPLSVVGVGTSTGGPIRQADGRLVVETDEVVVAKLPASRLRRLARAGGGQFKRIDALGSSDALAEGDRRALSGAGAAVARRHQRVDEGYWLVLIMLALGVALSRRGWLLTVAGAALLIPALPVEATPIDDWWMRPDQHAAAAYARPDQRPGADLEARLTNSPRWRAIVLFRAGQFARAARLWGRFGDATAHYNRANALAIDGALLKALEAYDLALELEPEFPDAIFNRALVEEALARQQQQQNRGTDRNSDKPRQTQGDGSAGSADDEASGADSTPKAEPTPPAGEQTPQTPVVQTEDTRGVDDSDPQGTSAAPADEDELRRLEGLLAKIPDEPGTLLKNRFALEYKQRSNKHQDTGQRW
ncbi:MAG: VWA domain-containing protein [Pseudomonadota bacterium]